MRSPFPRRAVAAALALALAATGCGRKPETAGPAPGVSGAKPLVVGLVFDVGGRGDKSFNDAAYAGLERAKQELGIEFVTLESGEGADREAGLRQLAAGDAALIFGVGFLFTDDIRRLAQEWRAPTWSAHWPGCSPAPRRSASSAACRSR
jgi:basic membrane protein A